MVFGTCLAEFDFGTGWVHDVSWSPSGVKVAYVAHDSSVVVVDSGGDVSVLKSKDLPYTSIQFISENAIVAAGHDANPAVYAAAGGGAWQFVKKLDAAQKKAATQDTSTAAGRSRAAFNKFKQADKLGSNAAKNVSTTLNTVHQNAIVGIRPQVYDQAWNVNSLVTRGNDGQLISWNVKGEQK
jgi:actin related protein 2/3 complex subunit 1A/1B